MINPKKNSRIGKSEQTKLTWRKYICQYPHEKSKATSLIILIFCDEIYQEDRDDINI